MLWWGDVQSEMTVLLTWACDRARMKLHSRAHREEGKENQLTNNLTCAILRKEKEAEVEKRDLATEVRGKRREDLAVEVIEKW